jgi:uncharacterized protein
MIKENNFEKILHESIETVAPAWSLTNFVASNPLKSLEDMDFFEAAKVAKSLYAADILPSEELLLSMIRNKDFDFKILESKVLEYFPANDYILRNISRKHKICYKQIARIYGFLAEDSSKFIKSHLFKKYFLTQKNKLEILLQINSQYQSKILEKVFKFSQLDEKVNRELIKWLELFYDEGQALITMPNKSKGFYNAWRELVIFDIDKNERDFIGNLASDPLEAIQELLVRLAIPECDWKEHLKFSLAKLSGWTSFIKWKMNYQVDSASCKKAPPSLYDYLAVRFALEFIVLKNCSEDKLTLAKHQSDDQYLDKFILWLIRSLFALGLSDDEILETNLDKLLVDNPIFINIFAKRGQIILESLENNFDVNLRSKLSLNSIVKESRSEAQVVFCIDVRSEPFRRQLETVSNYETYGFAGFFGVPIRYKAYDKDESCDSCPVLIKPKHYVYETIKLDNIMKNKVREENDNFRFSFNYSMKYLRMSLTSVYAFAEATGIIYACRILLKTLLPKFYKQLQINSEARFNPRITLEQIIEKNPNIKSESLEIGININDQIHYAEGALKLIGLTKNFSRIIIFCGHGSLTENNPYASSLDCGACGGNHGSPNARVLAKILNSSVVKDHLSKKGLMIPKDTVFIAAEHTTTNDNVTFFDDDLLSQEDKIKLRENFKKAKYLNNLYRLDKMPSDNLPEIRSIDWSETRPEWGLAGNAAFIIGPRAVTKGIDLESRVFLHSYNYLEDPDAKSLETIMTAPMIVTQWINAQYYFSSIDNVIFGSSSKITQNVYGTCAIAQGNASDLMTGLPLQSVYSDDENLFHQPLRITNYIFAPKQNVERIIKSHESLKKLVINKWIKIIVYDPNLKVFSEPCLNSLKNTSHTKHSIN